MKIAFVASEMVPFAKTGGLGDVVGTLPVELAELGHEVYAFLPRYKDIEVQKWSLKTEISPLTVPIGSEKENGRVFSCKVSERLRVFFIDHLDFYGRDYLYGTPMGDYPDNDRRFIFFQRGVLETIRILKLKVDIVHCHDWQTGLIPVYLKTLYANDPLLKKAKSVFSIHNLGYQGNFPPDSLPYTGLGWEQFSMERLEFYGKISFIKAGLLDADAISTVSESYAKEIQTKEFGCGMENVLAARAGKIYGIVNGIDYKEWSPETDPDIAAKYNFKTLEKKQQNKLSLQDENDFKQDPKVPLLGIVARLADQKGIDILVPALNTLLKKGIQFVLLGTGEDRYHQIFRDLAKKNAGNFRAHILFDVKMAKRIYAGCDMILVPSYYEPCGLGQIIALRYGTVPIVRATGGLADTISEFDPATGKGNGFAFQQYSETALLASIEKALQVYKNEKNWKKLIQNAMESDFSWRASAQKYVQLYEKLTTDGTKNS